MHDPDDQKRHERRTLVAFVFLAAFGLGGLALVAAHKGGWF